MSRSITIEDLYQFKFLSRPRISPDGQRVAFVVTTIDERKHEYRSSIWVVPSEGGEAKRFTGGIANTHTPSWSPDGRWLAFVSEREGEASGANKPVGADVSRPAPIYRLPAHTTSPGSLLKTHYRPLLNNLKGWRPEKI